VGIDDRQFVGEIEGLEFHKNTISKIRPRITEEFWQAENAIGAAREPPLQGNFSGQDAKAEGENGAARLVLVGRAQPTFSCPKIDEFAIPTHLNPLLQGRKGIRGR